ncbi:eukaryotic translation initiation factor 2 (eIF-2) family protein [Actinidia rufa]|uniref:Eukaryotic translation initiation factor 5B n=1 Tax=Actinidia rufa TaxID=165716 RepID=A0A7J0GGJ2_9ERIC|nr:eukaryotic translation initiation factor 2 (eIF-2) family protein [Actinidia rufa]
MGRKKPTARDEESAATAAAVQGGGGKSKKKAVLIDDDEYSVGTELPEEQSVQDEKIAPGGGKKKGKKGGSKNLQPKDEDVEEKDVVDEYADDVPAVQFAGKKKSKFKKGGSNNLLSASSFGLLGEEDEDEDESVVTRDEDDGVATDEEEEVVVAFTGKKKASKTKKSTNNSFKSSAFGAIAGDEDEDVDSVMEQQDDDNEEPVIAFLGKKKPSKSNKKSSGNVFSESSFDGIEMQDEVKEEDDAITFSGKKKSSKVSKKNSSLFSAALVDEENEEGDSCIQEEDASVIIFSGKKKSSKKKNNSVFSAVEDEYLDESEQPKLGEGSMLSKPATTPSAPPEEKKTGIQPEPIESVEATEEKEGGEGGVESAAAKKKKKKKEKEKEKKAAAAAVASIPTEEERLAKLKELEEKKKREEEEKLRKEEEERRRQEELERLAEEKKRLKKEKEKEKLLKKKQEGRLLTGKQKEEARRLEAMRNQILANAGGLPLTTGDAGGAATKRPKYQTKKSKQHSSLANGVATAKPVESTEATDSQQETVAEVDSMETEMIEEVDTMNVEEKTEMADVIEENEVEEDEDEDEWDAKSWDDADLKLPAKSAFADEEADSEPEPLVKKVVKSLQPASREAHPPAVAASKITTTVSVKSEDAESQNKQKEPTGKMRTRNTDAQPNQNESNLRSPICCIMGHVDTGKTKLLDCIRGTNVQEGEAGGITQQIGATYFPAENIRERTKELKADAKLNVPGLLVIDTPGHESFTNLRSRGSGLCDIAILVVDIMHGLEPQTIESLNLLKMRNTEFIVALNKVDRLYGWKTCRNAPIVKTMKQQSKDVQLEFNMRLTQVITQFKEQGLNTELYYKNKEMGETFSIVPTSAISGEGIPDLLLLLVQWTQKTMIEKLTYSNEMQCTVLEVKVVEGHGTTIDVVLVNGVLHEGDQIVGPIVTSIRALLTPHPMKELRVKGTYLHHKEIKAAQGIKITAQGLEHAIAGTGLYVVGPDDDLEDIKESAMEDMKSVLSRIDKTGEGVCVQASTLGSLEALLEFLKSPAVSIPVSGISIGPVHKKDVMKASVMLEKKKEYATILAFDVKVTPEARELADEAGVKIFIADIIYHLFDQFKAYIDNLKEEKKKEAADEAVFPCVLKIMPNCVFNKKDPIVLGVDVLEGIAKVGTPICIPQKEFIDIGRIASIENNHKPVDYAKKGQKVAIKIVGSNSDEQQKMFGRHFEIEDELVSHISRRSIDILKTNYRDDLSMDEWRLVVKLKTLFKIQ